MAESGTVLGVSNAVGEAPQLPVEGSSLPTPVRAAKMEAYLTRHGYDPILLAKLSQGFKLGFSLGFKGVPLNNRDISNLRSCFDHPDIVDKAIGK